MQIDFIAAVPLQIKETLKNDTGLLKLNTIQKIIIGGAPIPYGLLKAIKKIKTDVYETYGMTESISHIALKKLTNRRIITVFGCGGDRDKKKRPRMGKVAAELADFVVITSDNPRSEDPKRIIDDIVKGLPSGFKDYKVSLDRKKAIGLSLAMAKDDDIVLIAGKGHEKYPVLKDTTVAFDDSNIATEILESNEVEEKV